jgi:hypothetical protein|tara:strand:- start:16 stop:408 length:393 start_codon:yes stop_codon:yes gene_type:complete
MNTDRLGKPDTCIVLMSSNICGKKIEETSNQKINNDDSHHVLSTLLKRNEKYIIKKITDDKRILCLVLKTTDDYVSLRSYHNSAIYENISILFEDINFLWNSTGKDLLWQNSNKRHSTLIREKKRQGWVS